MKSTPIILLVSERSGSNLLRTLIGKHKEICAPVAPHLMAEFYNIRKYYGDLRVKENSYNLLTDMLKVANHPYHDWKLKMNVESFSNEAISLVNAFDILYSAKAVQEDKIHYCSKGVHSFNFIDPLRAELENVKFVHLVRDPRDHVTSWMKRPINLLTPYDTVLKWKSEQEVFIDAVTTKSLECISVKYEDLISDTTGEMTRILQYIGIDIDENCFTTNKANEESKRNPYWQNLAKPIMSDNKEKFKKELTTEDILIIETIAKKEMEFFGYTPITSADWLPKFGYNNKLAKIREMKKRELKLNPEENIDFKDKLDLVRAIRAKRKSNWKEKNYINEKINAFSAYSFKKLPIMISIKNRIKHLSFGLLGERLTKNILAKIN